MHMHRTTILLPEDLKASAEAHARRQGISVGELIRRQLKVVTKSKKTTGKTASRRDDPLFAITPTFNLLPPTISKMARAIMTSTSRKPWRRKYADGVRLYFHRYQRIFRGGSATRSILSAQQADMERLVGIHYQALFQRGGISGDEHASALSDRPRLSHSLD